MDMRATDNIAAGEIAAGEILEEMRRFRFASLPAITGGGTVMILSPHPDDESLGCGGLIAAACAAGTPPLLVFLTDGTGSHPNSSTHPPAALRELREQEAHAAAAILGLTPDRLVFLRLPDRFAPHEGPAFEQAVVALAALAARHGCGRLFAPWRHDPHGDHVAAHRIAAACAARVGIGLVSYPVWGWTLPESGPLPGPMPRGHRLDISGFLAAKCRAIAAHASQHGGVVTDDPDGAVLPAAMLANFQRRYEVFIEEG
jgi:LmbE family N-acetylglucosaminyl deacetylase